MNKVKITILYDDYNGTESGFFRSFGFSALIEKNKKKILFDAGTKTEELAKNLERYGVKPISIDAVVLSHNHYDHTDGIDAILRYNEHIPVYVHKYWDDPVTAKGKSIPPTNQIIIERGREIEEIMQGFFITNPYLSQEYGGIHEQACYIKGNSEYVLLTGCSHPGLNSFLEDRYKLQIDEAEPLHIIGGFHRFKFTEDEVKKYSPIIKSIIYYHCTRNAEVFRSQFRDKCSTGVVGKTLFF